MSHWAQTVNLCRGLKCTYSGIRIWEVWSLYYKASAMKSTSHYIFYIAFGGGDKGCSIIKSSWSALCKAICRQREVVMTMHKRCLIYYGYIRTKVNWTSPSM